jgi:hypothetical protein
MYGPLCVAATSAFAFKVTFAREMDRIKGCESDWSNGEYTQQRGLAAALDVLLIMGSSPPQMQKQAPAREKADDFLETKFPRTRRPLMRTTCSTTLTRQETTTRSRNWTKSPHRSPPSTLWRWQGRTSARKALFLGDRNDSQLCAERTHWSHSRTSAKAFRPCAHRRTRKSKL